MTIKQVCEKYDITADTLRYYEKVGVIPSVPRNENGVRNFDEDSLGWIELAICMRKAGVQIEALSKYVSLFKVENSTEQRKKILLQQKEILENKMKDMQDTLDRLNYKISLYDEGKIRECKINCVSR